MTSEINIKKTAILVRRQEDLRQAHLKGSDQKKLGNSTPHKPLVRSITNTNKSLLLGYDFENDTDDSVLAEEAYNMRNMRLRKRKQGAGSRIRVAGREKPN